MKKRGRAKELSRKQFADMRMIKFIYKVFNKYCLIPLLAQDFIVISNKEHTLYITMRTQ